MAAICVEFLTEIKSPYHLRELQRKRASDKKSKKLITANKRMNGMSAKLQGSEVFSCLIVGFEVCFDGGRLGGGFRGGLA